jgi:predicted HicB family RNase H-like nuclease
MNIREKPKPFRLFDIKARVEPEFKNRVRLAAKQRGLSMGAFVRFCINLVLNEGTPQQEVRDESRSGRS